MNNKLIIGISGKKQSGKDTTCKYLVSDLRYLPDSSRINTSKIYSFADSLKRKICIDILGLTECQCFGTNEQKNSLTNCTWDKLPMEIRENNLIKKNAEDILGDLPTGRMTGRDVMQVVGTDIFRNFFDDRVWVNATFRDIEKEGHDMSLIADVRFPSEVEGILSKGGYIIRLERAPLADSHDSETALDNYDWESISSRASVINNSTMTIDEQNNEAINCLHRMIKNK